MEALKIALASLHEGLHLIEIVPGIEEAVPVYRIDIGSGTTRDPDPSRYCEFSLLVNGMICLAPRGQRLSMPAEMFVSFLKTLITLASQMHQIGWVLVHRLGGSWKRPMGTVFEVFVLGRDNSAEQEEGGFSFKITSQDKTTYGEDGAFAPGVEAVTWMSGGCREMRVWVAEHGYHANQVDLRTRGAKDWFRFYLPPQTHQDWGPNGRSLLARAHLPRGEHGLFMVIPSVSPPLEPGCATCAEDCFLAVAS